MRSSAALLALALVLAPATPALADDGPAPVVSGPVPTAEPSPVAEPSPAAPAAPRHRAAAAEDTTDIVEIDDAELRWGVTNESNNMSHAPGRFNFFSAGRIADPGKGGSTVTQSGWKQRSGSVAIEKSNGSTYAAATWAGLKTTATGAPITSSSSRQFSDHQIVFGDGTGEVDPETGDGSIQWDGDATVIYYSGFTFFYVSDPELTVEDGVGTVRATLGGFSSSQEDLDVWGPLPATRVVLADLGQVDLTGDAKGFTVTPTYLGRTVTGVDQVRQGAVWGSFPQSFVDFHVMGGAAGFWFSSGSAFDDLKVPLPLTVSLDADDAVEPTVPPPSTGGGDDVTNDIVRAPNTVPTSLLPSNLSPLAPTSSLALPGSVVSAAGFQQVSNPVTLTADGPRDPGSSAALWWWLGAAFLTLAGASVAGTYAYSAASPRR